MGCNTTKEVVPQGADKGGEKQDDESTALAASEEKSSEPFPEYNADDPDTVIAVTKIQAAYRGHRTRKVMQQDQAEPTKEQLEAEFSADDKELCQAATKIQASFRGHLSRKEIKDKTDELEKEMEKLETKKEEEEEVLDIDLNDPELHKAATKIQASFRGHKVRKEPAGNAEKNQQ